MSQVYESNLPRFLSEMARMDAGDDEIQLNFDGVKYWIPAAIATMCSMVNRWTARGRKVGVVNLDACPARGYLQRMDFFDRIGLTLPEDFQRKTPGTSFVELQQILPGIARLHDPVAQRLGCCLAGTDDPTNDVLRFTQFAVGEIVANCQQHSGKPGFVSAQYVAKHDWARIGIADYGMGVLAGFRVNQSPDYVDGMTDADALLLALQPWKSSKRHLKLGTYGESPNRGAGLTMIHYMIAESCGQLMIASGNAVARIVGSDPVRIDNLDRGLSFPGTVVSLLFCRDQIGSFQELLSFAQRAMNLTSDPEDDIFG